MLRKKKRILDMRTRITLYLILLSIIPALIIAIYMGISLARLGSEEALNLPEIFQILLVILGVLSITTGASFLLGFLIARSLANPLSRLEGAIQKISEGNLNLQVQSESADEIGKLYNNFERMINVLNDILADIYDSTNSIIYFKDNIDEVISTFNYTIQEQTQSVENSKAVFKELNESVKSVEKSVRSSLKVTSKAQGEVQNANQRINELVEEMDNINTTSREISRVTEIINGIAEKTRLLSLNAAIEAKRSGEAGRGFAVVSTEIRKLAAQSNQAVNEIDILIKRNEKIIRSGVSKTTEMKGILNQISESFNQIIQIINLISEATTKEGKSTLGIMDTIGTFTDVTTKNIKFSESLQTLKEKLSREVDKIRNLIFTFKTDVSNREIINDIKEKTREEQIKLQKRKQTKKMEEVKERNKKKQAEAENEISNPEDLGSYKPSKKGLNFNFKWTKKDKNTASVPGEQKTKKRNIKIPEKLNLGQFNAQIGVKVQLEEDMTFIKDQYDYDEFEEKYFLKQNISSENRDKLKEILIRIGF